MRSEEEIRKKIEELEEEVKELEWEKDYLKKKSGGGWNTAAYTLYIDELKERIKTLRWVLGEVEET